MDSIGESAARSGLLVFDFDPARLFPMPLPPKIVELAVIIGKGGRAIKAAHAMDHVAGYSLLNGATIRDYQFRIAQPTGGETSATRARSAVPGAEGRDTDPGVTEQSANTSGVIIDDPHDHQARLRVRRARAGCAQRTT